MIDVDADVVRKELKLQCSPQVAFEVFTARLDTWWPLKSHSCSQDEAANVRFPRRVGDPIIEVAPDGTEHVWGTVTSWSPPDGFSCTWHPGGDPGDATEFTVTFEPLGDGTRFVLAHSGWSGRPEGRANYDKGWDHVLALYVGGARQAS